MFTCALAVLTVRHELWRDEMQAWLLARAADTPWHLLSLIKYEGHPGLWHLWLWPLAQLWNNPAGMQIMHVMLAAFSVFLLYRFAPFAWPIRVLISAGYYFAYEYAVIARNYAIAIPLVFLICVLSKERWRFFPYIAGLFFLLCHTHVGAIIITIVAMVMLAVDFAVSYAGKFRKADMYLRRVLLGFVIILSGIATGIIQIKPPADSGFATGWYLTWNQHHFERITSTVVNAMLPLPPAEKWFWNCNRLLVNDIRSAPRNFIEHLRIEQAHPAKAAGLIVFGAFLLFLRHPWPGLQWILTTVSLVLFYYVKYSGSWRHHGTIYIAFIMCFWMSYYYDPWRLPWRIPEKICGFIDRHRAWLLAPLLVLHAAGAWAAVRIDWSEKFSMARDAAAWLKREYPEWRNCVIIAQDMPQATPLCGYLEAKPLYYAPRGEYGTYVIWDQQQNKNGKKSIFQCAAELAAKEKKKCLLILPREMRRKDCRALRAFHGSTVGDEIYWIYEWQGDAK